MLPTPKKKTTPFVPHHFSTHRGDKRQFILSSMFQSVLKRILNKMNTWHKTNVCEIKLKQQLVHNSNNYNIILFYIEINMGLLSGSAYTHFMIDSQHF